MVSAENPPGSWIHNPSDVRVKKYSNIDIEHVWKNEETGEVLIQFMTVTAVQKNKYVEKHTDPDKVESRLRKVKDLVSSGDVESELDKVAVTGGGRVAKCSRRKEATQQAIDYMKNS